MDIRVDVIRSNELTAHDREIWMAFRAASPALASPYFDVRYTLAAGGVVPGAAVAVVRRGGAS